MQFSKNEIAQMIDFSAVAGGVGEAEVEEMAAYAKKYQFIGAHVLPCYVKKLSELLAGEDAILVGAGIGFPSGAHTTEVKVHEAKLALADGCRELDMVINVGALRSGKYQYCTDEIRAIVDVAAGKPIKVILEVHHLTDDQIKRGCQAVIDSGAQYVKTATGWAPSGATPENIALIKSFVGDAVQVKAAGGIRTLAMLKELYRLGARRFGIGTQSALKIMAEIEALPDELVIIEE